MTNPNSAFDNSNLLEKNALEAVSNAIKSTLAKNIPIVYAEGGTIYREFSDGSREVCTFSDETLVPVLPALGLLDLASTGPQRSQTPGKKIVRIFAGPNGSGKSTIYDYIAQRYESGTFINADNIQRQLEKDNRVSLDQFNLSCSEEEVRTALRESSWGWEDNGAAVIRTMTVFPGPEIRVDSAVHGYAAAIIADILRTLMLRQGVHFSFETVMSHPSKVEFMWEANRLGYTCYLYFVCTRSPKINIERVRARVARGGHGVSSINIVNRYYRTLKLLKPAINLSYRSFIFDNSEKIDNLAKDAGSLLRLEFKEGDAVHAFDRNLPKWVSEFALKEHPVS